MNKNFFAGLFLCLSLQGFAQNKATEYAETITPQDLKKHLQVIASDSLEGRDTGSPGQKKAADYVAKHFAANGLLPIAKDAGGASSYFQPYKLYQGAWGDVYLKTGSQSYQLQEDFFLNGLINIPQETELKSVWAGYGIESETYNDYAGLSVNDKAVIIFEGEPKSGDGRNLVNGIAEPSKWGSPMGWQQKVQVALSKGAKAVIMISEKEASDFGQELRRRSVMDRRFNRMTLKPAEEALSNHAVFVVSTETGAALLKTTPDKLLALKNKLNAGSRIAAKKRPSGSITVKAERISQVIETENVAGLLEGSDKKEEVVVLTAHLDHIGVNPDGQINNGADDDGSGVVSILELAEAFSKAKADGMGPRRSILFMTVTGEEKGLLGSSFYVDNPLFPLENTVANLNIDMLGRVDEAHKDDHKYVYLIGSDKLSSELHMIGEEVNTQYIGYNLDYTFNDPNDPNRFYYRSDHYNFAKKGIPVVFYFTGVHEDYHRPGDTVDKILFDKQTPIVKLVFYTAWELANRPERIKVDSNKP